MELKTVTYTQAKQLKELGFIQDDYRYCYLDGILTSQEEYNEYDCGGPFSVELAEAETISAPELEIAKQQFINRDISIEAICSYSQKVGMCWIFKIYKISTLDMLANNYYEDEKIHKYFKTYDDALSAGIDKAIQIFSNNH